MQQYISAIENIWYNDGCHTLDRENYIAQIDCGIGNFDTTLSNAVGLRF